MILLDFFLFLFYFPFCLCPKKGNNAFRDVPADTVNTGLWRFPLCHPYFPYFHGIREMEINHLFLFVLCVQFISLFCLFLGNGNKKGHKTVEAEPALCMANGTAVWICTPPEQRPNVGRTPPLTSPRACGEARLTDGTGTQGQAGRTQPTDGALYHSHTGNPRAGRAQPGGWFTASGCESRDRQGIRHLLRFLLCVGLMGGFTAVLWPHGGPAVYMKIKTYRLRKRGKPL